MTRAPASVCVSLNPAERLAAAHVYLGAGRPLKAIKEFGAAVDEASLTGERQIEAQACRWLAVVHHRRGARAHARALAMRSLTIGVGIGDDRLQAEGLNSLAAFDLEEGDLVSAAAGFQRALDVVGESWQVRGRIEQNRGVLANIHGDLAAAGECYRSALEAFRAAGDQPGSAIALHNIGMLDADQRHWEAAEQHFRESRVLATITGDLHLVGLCQLNVCEVHLARQQFEDARRSAEAALQVFDRLGETANVAGAYRVLGIIYRETGIPTLSEARLRASIDLARQAGSVLMEADATREVAELYRGLARNVEALEHLNAARTLYERLDARTELHEVVRRGEELEAAYLAVVRSWGQSIESTDTYTYGHCDRVATLATAVARELGLDESAQTTIRMGAYLHDLGKVRVPHQILNKPGPLTSLETETMRQHPVWGLELVAHIKFPWEVKPIIRSHHEKWDGSGYPDALVGSAIPLHAQVVCIADVYDALTTSRSYKAALSLEGAMLTMSQSRHWWSDEVFAAFVRATT